MCSCIQSIFKQSVILITIDSGAVITSTLIWSILVLKFDRKPRLEAESRLGTNNGWCAPQPLHGAVLTEEYFTPGTP